MEDSMSLILIVTIVLAVSSTLACVCFCVGIRALPGATVRQSRWIIGSVLVAAAWLLGVLLLGGAGNGVLPPRIPLALGVRCLWATSCCSPRRSAASSPPC